MAATIQAELAALRCEVDRSVGEILAAAGLLALAAGLSLLAVKGMSADRIPLFVLAGMVAAAAGPLLVLALLLFRAGRPRVGAPR